MFKTSLVVQWLKLCTSTAGGTGSIPGWGSSACLAVQPKQQQQKAKKNPTNKKHTFNVSCHHCWEQILVII